MTTSRQRNEGLSDQQGASDAERVHSTSDSTASTASTEISSSSLGGSIVTPSHEQMQERQMTENFAKTSKVANEPIDEVDKRIADYVAKATKRERQVELQNPTIEEELNATHDIGEPCYES